MVPLETFLVCESLLLILIAALLFAVYKHHIAIATLRERAGLPREEHTIKTAALGCDHLYRFGGRELTNGKYITTIVCDKCKKAQRITEE